MTWKSTVAASGLALVGTWLASYAPVGGPRPEVSSTPSAARTETAAAEIQREADRLHDRLKQAAAYRAPGRNPFQFAAPRPAAPAPPSPAPAIEESVASAPQPPTLRVMLSGIAEDVVTVDDQQAFVRTAIISTPDNVHLVKVGETVAGTYKVVAIGAATVDLVRLDDGSTVQLSLKQP
jgi:hypothetical protein